MPLYSQITTLSGEKRNIGQSTESQREGQVSQGGHLSQMFSSSTGDLVAEAASPKPPPDSLLCSG